jgi:hypothetical protein
MSSGAPKNSCRDVAPLLVFYACGECTDEERHLVEQHLAICTSCKAQLADELEFENTLRSLSDTSQQLDPSGILLGQCRTELVEQLDEIEHPRLKEPGGFGWLRRWMGLHPLWSAATLVLLGLVAGAQLTQWFTGGNDANGVDAVSVRPSGPHLTEDQLSKMVLAGVNFAPSTNNPGAKTVRLQLSAQQPVELSGGLDDTDVRSVLTYVVKNGERFDSGVRLDCLDALKALAEDGQVREALLAAARRDQNPAVRLKALEALRDSAADAEVRDTLLAALQHDSNPGVRVEAVNLLVRSIGAGGSDALVVTDPSDFSELPHSQTVRSNGYGSDNDSMQNVIRTLEELQQKDPSRYVRMRSAAALREISVRSEQ